MKRILFIVGLILIVNINIVEASTTSASSYVLMDNTTGRVLASKDMDSKRLIASITNIMTT